MANKGRFKIEWEDLGREPQHPPNPEFPEGVHFDMAQGVTPACRGDLPYPAKRCGRYFVKCRRCFKTIVVSTAGRYDDPRSITIPCRATRH